MQATCSYSFPQARWSKKKGQEKRTPKGLAENFTAVFLPTHEIQLCHCTELQFVPSQEQSLPRRGNSLSQTSGTSWAPGSWKALGCCWHTLPPKMGWCECLSKKLPHRHSPGRWEGKAPVWNGQEDSEPGLHSSSGNFDPRGVFRSFWQQTPLSTAQGSAAGLKSKHCELQ